MPLKFENYRFTDGKTQLSAATLNPRFQDLDTRIAALEALKVSWAAAVQQVTDFGLERIDTLLSAAIATLNDETASAAAAIAQIDAQYEAAQAQVASLASWIANYEASVRKIPAPPVGTSLLAGDGNGGFANIALGPNLRLAGSTLSGPLTWSSQAASFNAAVGGGYLITMPGVVVSLPTGTADGQQVAFVSSLAANTSFNVAPAAGQTVMGDTSLNVDVPYASLTLVYFVATSDWRIF